MNEVIEFPKHKHPAGDGPTCLHCKILHLMAVHYGDQGLDEVPAIEATQYCVEVLADLINYGVKREHHEGALRDVIMDLEHALLQKRTFGPQPPEDVA